MSAGELRMPAAIAWLFFAPGVLFVIVDIIRLNITGLFLLGVVFLVLWAWLIGAFTREFWGTDIGPDHPDALESLDMRERNTQIPAGGIASPSASTPASVTAPPAGPRT